MQQQRANILLDLLFPPICLACGTFGEILCRNCLIQIREPSEFICPGCLQTTLDGQKHAACSGPLDGLVATWSYKGVIQKMIKSVKYRSYWAFFPKIISLHLVYLQQVKYQKFQQFIQNQPLIIPVPLHRAKYRQRGFNQAEILAKILSRHYQLPLTTQVLERQINTRPQSELSKKDRAENIKNAFIASTKVLKISSQPLQGKSALLVDDVWTTGSTLQACARVLKKLGAAKIWALTLAR